jgi:tetratricopeptide (TPR) repeat protein
MPDSCERPTPEAYVVSLLAEGKYDAAFASISEFGDGYLYASDFSNLALQLAESGQPEVARELFQKALTLDPELAPAYSGLGILHLRAGRLVLAVQNLRRAAELNPALPGPLVALGIALCNSGHPVQAVDHLVQALEISPGLAPALNALQEIRSALRGKSGKKKPAQTNFSNNHAALIHRIDAALQKYHQPAAGKTSHVALSVSMIVKNEAENLARCLQSVRRVADEIVVVDTGSTDNTVQIAESFGAKIGYFKWCDDFAAARNYSLSLASGDWVLSMDGDDELVPGGDVTLRLFLETLPKVDVCSLRTRVPVVGGLETFIDHPRLFRNHRGYHYVHSVHEQLVNADGLLVLPQAPTGISVYHHGYLAGPEEMQERRERNLRILEAELAARPEDGGVYFFLAKEYRALNKFAETIPYLRRSLKLTAGQPTSFVRMKTYAYLVDALNATEQPVEAEQLAREALAHYPDHPELLFNLGEALALQNREAEAVAVYEAATQGRFGNCLANQDFTCRDLKPLIRLAEIAIARGRIDDAECYWRKARNLRGDIDLLGQIHMRIEFAREQQYAVGEAEAQLTASREQLARDPDNLSARIDLASALIALGRAEEVQRDMPLESFAPTEETFNDAALLCKLAAIYHTLGYSNLACQAFQAAVHTDPFCTPAYLGLGALYMKCESADAALSNYEAALQIDPASIPAWLGAGKIYLQKQVLPAALSCFDKAVQLSGGAPEVMAELAAARRQLVALSEAGVGG